MARTSRARVAYHAQRPHADCLAHPKVARARLRRCRARAGVRWPRVAKGWQAHRPLLAIVAGAVLAVAGCVPRRDDAPTVERNSCELRSGCDGSDDVLFRQAYICASDVDEATRTVRPPNISVAAERCGADQLWFSWTVCDDDPVGGCDDE